MNGKARSYIFIVIAAFLWGCIGVFYKLLSAAGLSSLQSVAVRIILSAVFYTAYLLVTDRKALKIRPRDFLYFVGTGICSLAFFNWCYFSCIDKSSMAVAAVLLYTAPIFVTLLSAALFAEKLTRLKIAALVLTFCGCLLVTGAVGTGGRITGGALLFGLGSGVGYALYTIFGKLALQKYSSVTVTAYSFIFGAVGLLPLTHFGEVGKALITPGGAIGGVCIAVLCCILPYILYTSGLKNAEPGRASMMATLEPVVASVLGIAVYHEDATAGKILGIVMVVGAVILLSITGKEKSEN